MGRVHFSIHLTIRVSGPTTHWKPSLFFLSKKFLSSTFFMSHFLATNSASKSFSQVPIISCSSSSCEKWLREAPPPFDLALPLFSPLLSLPCPPKRSSEVPPAPPRRPLPFMLGPDPLVDMPDMRPELLPKGEALWVPLKLDKELRWGHREFLESRNEFAKPFKMCSKRERKSRRTL